MERIWVSNVLDVIARRWRRPFAWPGIAWTVIQEKMPIAERLGVGVTIATEKMRGSPPVLAVAEDRKNDSTHHGTFEFEGPIGIRQFVRVGLRGSCSCVRRYEC